MLFKSTNKLNGDSTVYGLNPQIKPFTLQDVGFSKSNAGDFIMKHPLGLNGPRLKIVVRPDFKTFKMDITDNLGLRKVNIFDNRHSSAVEQFNYLISTLVLRKVLIRK